MRKCEPCLYYAGQMTCKLALEQMWEYCPPEWKNFVGTLGPSSDNGVSYNIISDGLLPFSARYFPMHNEICIDPYIEFDTESDLIVFKLKYSN